jgi:hypothetical protein
MTATPAASTATSPTSDSAPPFDWHSEYAYALGVLALIYGFPLVYGAATRYKWVTIPQDPAHVPYAAVNHFWHAPNVLDATYQDGGCPNNDTLYSVAWVDLSDEPIILSHPDMEDRYFSFELSAMTSDNFDYVGQRTTGSKAGSFLIPGPGWEGEVPDGVTAVAPSPTPWALCLGRTLVDGQDDVPVVNEVMKRYSLTPLSLWGQADPHVPERRDVLAPIDVASDPLGPWKTLNAMLAENPPPAEHGILLQQFASVGIGPGLDIEEQPDVVKDSLARALGAGMKLLPAQFLSGDWATNINGWRYPPPTEGRAGDDFLRRGAELWRAGFGETPPPEAVYLVCREDADGKPLSSDGRYELSFSGEDLPPVDSFWSLTMYKADMNLVPNPVDRYSVGDRTPGLVKDDGGGVRLSIQNAEPAADRRPNWLPCPAEGTWFVILRLYRPRPEVINATWMCPPIRRLA